MSEYEISLKFLASTCGLSMELYFNQYYQWATVFTTIAPFPTTCHSFSYIQKDVGRIQIILYFPQKFRQKNTKANKFYFVWSQQTSTMVIFSIRWDGNIFSSNRSSYSDSSPLEVRRQQGRTPQICTVTNLWENFNLFPC